MNQKDKNNREYLFRLMKENPELDIVPMVNSEVCCGEDYAYWLGSWDKADIDEIYSKGERIYFRSQDEEELIHDLVEEMFLDMEPFKDSLTGEEDKELEEKAERIVNNLNWKKVIVVYIGLP